MFECSENGKFIIENWQVVFEFAKQSLQGCVGREDSSVSTRARAGPLPGYPLFAQA